MKLVTDVTDKIPEDKNRPCLSICARSFPDCCGTAGNGNLGNFIDLAGGKNIAKDVLPTPLGTMNPRK